MHLLHHHLPAPQAHMGRESQEAHEIERVSRDREFLKREREYQERKGVSRERERETKKQKNKINMEVKFCLQHFIKIVVAYFCPCSLALHQVVVRPCFQ